VVLIAVTLLVTVNVTAALQPRNWLFV
jgi:hypothetical protein